MASEPFQGWGDHRLMRIRQRKRSGPRWESEGFIVPLEAEGQHNPGRGESELTLLCSCNRRAEDQGIAMSLVTPDTIRTLQRNLCYQRLDWSDHTRGNLGMCL